MCGRKRLPGTVWEELVTARRRMAMGEDALKTVLPTPWVWPFALLCFVIPVFSVGGALPAALGIGGGLYCLAIARDKKRSLRMKVVHCVVATLLAWVLFAIVAVAVEVVRIRSAEKTRTKHGAPAADTQRAQPPRSDVGGSARDRSVDGKNVSPGWETRRQVQPRALSPRDDVQRVGDNSDPLASDEARREIYAEAVSLRDDLQRAEERLVDYRDRGLSTEVPEKQLEHIKGMHEKRLEFTAKRYKISLAELDDVIREGDFEGWPVD
jgi:hypothetical protein